MIRHPEGFRFCFTVDTEPDDLWADRPTLLFSNFARLLDFHRKMADRGTRPTYLTTSEVAEDAPSARVMGQILEDGRAEVGAHFHSWTRRWPFDVPDMGDPPRHACAHQLGQEAEEKMLGYTCRALEEAFRVRPVSYRGGRWSLSGASVRSLRNCGITVDTTVAPGINWEDLRHPQLSGPDYRDFPVKPYYMSGDSLDPVEGHGEVLEVPVGAAWFPSAGEVRAGGLGFKVAGKLRKLMGKPHGHQWLRPATTGRADMRACMERLRDEGAPVWVAMIHSSEIVPCKYSPTEPDVARFVDRCLGLAEDAAALGAVGATLASVAGEYEKLNSGEVAHAGR